MKMLMAPIFEFAHSIAKLNLDNTEVAMLAAILLMQSGKFYNFGSTRKCVSELIACIDSFLTKSDTSPIHVRYHCI